MSYTTKTTAKLTKCGYVSQTVESYNYFAKKRKDLWGFGDLLAMNYTDPTHKLVAVQSTSKSNVSARYAKITSDTLIDPETKEKKPNSIPLKAKDWLRCGGHILIIGWDNDRKKCNRGKCIEIIYNLELDQFEKVDVSEKFNIDSSKSIPKSVKHVSR
jgi:hypothetical protein